MWTHRHTTAHGHTVTDAQTHQFRPTAVSIWFQSGTRGNEASRAEQSSCNGQPGNGPIGGRTRATTYAQHWSRQSKCKHIKRRVMRSTLQTGAFVAALVFCRVRCGRSQ